VSIGCYIVVSHGIEIVILIANLQNLRNLALSDSLRVPLCCP
jgi:hypothetical protein